jgi:hypothetical protein
MADGRAGQPNIGEALGMLNAFASVGARAVDVTLLDIEGAERGFSRNRGLDELRASIDQRLQWATDQRLSLVIRPRSASVLLVQLADFTLDRAEKITSHAFMTLCTSPGNYQLWVVVRDGPNEIQEKEKAKVFRTRLRRGTGADHSATGAVRIAGSLNFKSKFAPNFPLVQLTTVRPGATTSMAALEEARLIAQELPQPPASVPPSNARIISRRSAGLRARVTALRIAAWRISCFANGRSSAGGASRKSPRSCLRSAPRLMSASG